MEVGTCKQDISTNFEVGNPTKEGCIKGKTTPETEALSAYYKKLTQFKLYFNIMSGTAAIYYPYGIHSGISAKSEDMAQNMKAVIDSKKIVGIVNVKNLFEYLNEIPGTSVDYCYDKLKTRYSLQIWLPKINDHNTKLQTMEAYFEALRYAILELQLTDVDVAAAIYQAYSSIGRITVNVNLLICIFVTFFYSK